ncbi:hypothetical protein BC940DRAFT_295351 [Gongronella butleri]|nr:hypothetical protein BC940DRAFT_295351 [Gongronella butleri]
MTYSDYSLYQAPSMPPASWLTRFSVHKFKRRWAPGSNSKGISAASPTTRDMDDADHVSIVSAPGSLPSPISSAVVSEITPSPSTSTSSWSSIESIAKATVTTTATALTSSTTHKLPLTPTMTTCDDDDNDDASDSEPDDIILPALHAPRSNLLQGYFLDRPLPTQRRRVAREWQQKQQKYQDRHPSTADPAHHDLNSLAESAFPYFIGSSAASDQHADLIHKIQGKLAYCATAMDPSLVQLAKDVLSYIHDYAPVAPELRRLEPKLDACVRIRGGANGRQHDKPAFQSSSSSSPLAL